MKMSESLTVSGQVQDLEQIGQWVENVAEQWALPMSTTFAIQLCCEEAYSNTARHGISNTAPSSSKQNEVILLLGYDQGSVSLKIEDHGIRFNPLEVEQVQTPKTLDDAKIGGLGIQLMKKFAQEISYEFVNQTNRIMMRFKVGDITA